MPSILSALRLLGLDAERSPDAATIGPREAAWLSGYFAALSRGGDTSSLGAVLPTQAQLSNGVAKGSAAAEHVTRVRVLYGSETGNAATVAKSIAERVASVGVEVQVEDLASYKPRTLEREHTVVIVTSTHGDGTPPEPASRFFEMLQSPTAPKALPKLRFAVLGLGDSSYEHFCRAAKTLDERLAELGAQRLLPRLECDLDFAESSAQWTEQLLAHVGAANASESRANGNGAVHANGSNGHAVLGAADAPSYDKQRPFSATVLENFQITGRGSSKETRHLVLSLEDSGLQFAPGDALGVCAPNDPALAHQLARSLGLSGDEVVSVADTRTSLANALIERLDLITPSARFLQTWARASGSAELSALTQPGAEAECRRFLRAHHVLDIVRAYPASEIDAASLVQALRPLTPRLYSIASSLAAASDEAHLTVGVVRYEQHGRKCAGVASGHIAERVVEGQTLPVYVHVNEGFRLPVDPNAKLLMIGAGTGVAPYRAFLQERQASSAPGSSWLVFGERNFRTDFLYQTEWQAWLKDRTLSRLSLAFSRDGSQKVYVQHRLREQAAEVYAWLQDGAHVYVCGDAVGLAPDVHEALLSIIEAQVGTREHAVEYLRGLQDAGRYQRDVY